MAAIGLPELIVIGMILILVFGASRLPQLGEGLGRAVRSLKRTFKEDERIDVKAAPPPQQTPPPKPRPSSSEPTDAEIIDETKR